MRGFLLRSLWFGLAALALYGAILDWRLSPSTGFFLLSAVLVVYAGTEIIVLLQHEGGRVASPIVFASIWLFLVPFGLTNFLYILPEPLLRQAGISNPGYEWMNRAVALALVGVFGMWAGYRLRAADRAGEAVRLLPMFGRLIRSQFQLRWTVVVTCVVISVSARLLAFRYGVFGYNSEQAQLEGLSAYTQYLTLGHQLGLLSLATVALSYFATRRGALLVPLYVLLGVEIVFGFLSGFKGSVVIPVAVVVVSRMVIENRVPRWMTAGAAALLVFSYGIIEPYRELRYYDPNFENRNAAYAVRTLIDLATGEIEAPVTTPAGPSETAAQIGGRFRMTELAARAVAFKDEVGLAPDAPAFFSSLVLAPAYAVVPRLLWPEKPTVSIGAWFSLVVMGGTELTSVGMSTVAFLYYAGGALLVLIGFLLLGFMQRATEVTFLTSRAGALVMFIGLVHALVMVDSEFYTFIVTYIRYVPLLVIAQLALFRK
jgi:hypothetical protein